MQIRDSVARLASLGDLLAIPPELCFNIAADIVPLTSDEFRHLLELCGEFWQHDGDMTRPHAKLTSGKHSDGFVNVLGGLRFPVLAQLFAYHLASVVASTWVQRPKGLIVVGSSYAAIALANDVGRVLRAESTGFTEKGPEVVEDGKKRKTQLWDRFAIRPGKIVLDVEDLVTTSSTIVEVRRGIREGNRTKFGVADEVQFAPLLATVVNRSPDETFEDAPVVCLARYYMGQWVPDQCPLCQQGSPLIERPKKQWKELTGRELPVI